MPVNDTDPYSFAVDSAKVLRDRLGTEFSAAMVLGSGWHNAVDLLGTVEAETPMADIPGFLEPTVAGHVGSLAVVGVGNRRVLVLRGRSHIYEGLSASRVAHMTRVAVLAGCPAVIITNGCAGIREGFEPGMHVVISDHINLLGQSPLTGDDGPPPFGPRFLDLVDMWSPRLRRLAREADSSLQEGVYAAVAGPNYETPAEIRMLRTIGADLVGMSTVPEAIAAHQLGAEVFGLGVVENRGAGLSRTPITHELILEMGEKAMPTAIGTVTSLIERI